MYQCLSSGHLIEADDIEFHKIMSNSITISRA